MALHNNLLFPWMVLGVDWASVGSSNRRPSLWWQSDGGSASHFGLGYMALRPQSVQAADLSMYVWPLHGAWMSLSSRTGSECDKSQVFQASSSRVIFFITGFQK